MERARPYALGLFRIVFGLLFATRGAAGVFGVPGGHAVPFGTWPGWYAALIQLCCGVLVLLGVATRPAAFLASGSMAYAYFVVHQGNGLLPMANGGEAAAIYCWAFLLLVFTGPGALRASFVGGGARPPVGGHGERRPHAVEDPAAPGREPDTA
ncbi:DoxX family protein [Streptomyces sp. BI20]|uniref:DoxX family protein n=1 Tax=Streptomyces sp. BI20 TaxID=3403460 RepID=UPI003C76D612